MESIIRWADERAQQKKKRKKLSVKYIIIIMVVLVLIVIVWLLVGYTCKKEKPVYVDLDTGEEIDLEAERQAGTEIVFEE